jgi:hypothetical protein
MIDNKRKGMRCRQKKQIRSHAAMITPLDEGAITYEVENLEGN